MERYEIIRAIARGSYGSVFLCKDTQRFPLSPGPSFGEEDNNEGVVAVKVFDADESNAARQQQVCRVSKS